MTVSNVRLRGRGFELGLELEGSEKKWERMGPWPRIR